MSLSCHGLTWLPERQGRTSEQPEVKHAHLEPLQGAQVHALTVSDILYTNFGAYVYALLCGTSLATMYGYYECVSAGTSIILCVCEMSVEHAAWINDVALCRPSCISCTPTKECNIVLSLAVSSSLQSFPLSFSSPSLSPPSLFLLSLPLPSLSLSPLPPSPLPLSFSSPSLSPPSSPTPSLLPLSPLSPPPLPSLFSYPLSPPPLPPLSSPSLLPPSLRLRRCMKILQPAIRRTSSEAGTTAAPGLITGRHRYHMTSLSLSFYSTPLPVLIIYHTLLYIPLSVLYVHSMQL